MILFPPLSQKAIHDANPDEVFEVIDWGNWLSAERQTLIESNKNNTDNLVIEKDKSRRLEIEKNEALAHLPLLDKKQHKEVSQTDLDKLLAESELEPQHES